jgi:hypothetical protein
MKSSKDFAYYQTDYSLKWKIMVIYRYVIGSLMLFLMVTPVNLKAADDDTSSTILKVASPCPVVSTGIPNIPNLPQLPTSINTATIESVFGGIPFIVSPLQKLPSNVANVNNIISLMNQLTKGRVIPCSIFDLSTYSTKEEIYEEVKKTSEDPNIQRQINYFIKKSKEKTNTQIYPDQFQNGVSAIEASTTYLKYEAGAVIEAVNPFSQCKEYQIRPCLAVRVFPPRISPVISQRLLTSYIQTSTDQAGGAMMPEQLVSALNLVKHSVSRLGGGIMTRTCNSLDAQKGFLNPVQVAAAKNVFPAFSPDRQIGGDQKAFNNIDEYKFTDEFIAENYKGPRNNYNYVVMGTDKDEGYKGSTIVKSLIAEQLIRNSSSFGLSAFPAGTRRNFKRGPEIFHTLGTMGGTLPTHCPTTACTLRGRSRKNRNVFRNACEDLFSNPNYPLQIALGDAEKYADSDQYEDLRKFTSKAISPLTRRGKGDIRLHRLFQSVFPPTLEDSCNNPYCSLVTHVAKTTEQACELYNSFYTYKGLTPKLRLLSEEKQNKKVDKIKVLNQENFPKTCMAAEQFVQTFDPEEMQFDRGKDSEPAIAAHYKTFVGPLLFENPTFYVPLPGFPDGCDGVDEDNNECRLDRIAQGGIVG